MSKSATEAKLRDLGRQLEAEKTAHAKTRNELQAEIDRVWRLVPSHYISLMGAYPSLRRLLLVLTEAADLQDPSRGAATEDTMRTEYTPDGETLTQTERGVFTHRRHRANVEEMNRQLSWMAHKLSKLIAGSEAEYRPPDGECDECGRLLYQSDVGRRREYCSARCRKRAERKVRV